MTSRDGVSLSRNSLRERLIAFIDQHTLDVRATDLVMPEDALVSDAVHDMLLHPRHQSADWWIAAAQIWMDQGVVAVSRECLARGLQLLRERGGADRSLFRQASRIAMALADRVAPAVVRPRVSLAVTRRRAVRDGRGRGQPDASARDVAFRDPGFQRTSSEDWDQHLFHDGLESVLVERIWSRLIQNSFDDASLICEFAIMAQRLGDIVTARACYLTAARLAGIEPIVQEAQEDGRSLSRVEDMIREGLLLTTTAGSTSLNRHDAPALLGMMSELGAWALSNRCPLLFCELLGSDSGFRSLFAPAALRRQIRWMARALGWAPDLVLIDCGLLSKPRPPRTWRAPSPILFERRRAPAARDRRRIVRCLRLPGLQQSRRTTSREFHLRLGISPDALPDGLAFGPSNPLFVAAPGQDRVLASAAVAALVEQNVAVLWIRSAEHQDGAPRAEPQSIAHWRGGGAYTDPQARQWLSAMVGVPALRDALSSYLVSRAPAETRSLLAPAMALWLHRLVNDLPREPWRVPNAAFASYVSRTLVKSRAPGRSSPFDLRVLSLALEGALDLCGELIAALAAEKLVEPSQPLRLAVLDMPESGVRATLLSIVAIGGLLASSDADPSFTLNARPRGKTATAAPTVSPPPTYVVSLRAWAGAPPPAECRGTCVVLSGNHHPVLEHVVPWFEWGGRADQYGLAVFTSTLARDALRKNALGRCGTIVAPRPAEIDAAGFSAATGFETLRASDPDDLYEWTVEDACARVRCFLPVPL